ncbi:MAG: hypothetical protein IT378_09965 [Sandaracinaceae bacterium]|nr:hypothetical protein [Sandaracinaceae bacterium]
MANWTKKAAPLAVAAVLAAAILGGQGRAEAQTHDRNLFFGAGIGFGVWFNGGDAYFRAEEGIGYHVLNVGDHPGLYVAFAFGQAVTRFVTLSFAGRVGFDILVWQNQDLAVLVNPSLQLGAGLFLFSGQAEAGFFMQPSVEASIALLEGMLNVWWRPLAFDILIRDGGGAGYVMMWGANLNF